MGARGSVCVCVCVCVYELRPINIWRRDIQADNKRMSFARRQLVKGTGNATVWGEGEEGFLYITTPKPGSLMFTVLLVRQTTCVRTLNSKC